MPCPHASSIPPAPRFVNPPPGLFRLCRCLGHRTCLSTAQCKLFFFIILPLLTPALLSLCCPFMPRPFPHAASVLSCCVPSLMPHPLFCATSVLSCRIFTPTRAASTPLPLAYPGCIDVPTSVHCVRCLSPHRCPSAVHCALCVLCPHPLLHPCLTLCMHLCAIVHLLLYMY